jgi:hypothetical protein
MLTIRRVCPALALALCFAAACGDDSDTGDDDTPDFDAQPIDAEVPDAEVDRCETLCTCVVDFCEAEMQTCMTDCQALDDSVIECRIEHCGYAQTNPSFHCPHSLGDENSPGVPPACIQD